MPRSILPAVLCLMLPWASMAGPTIGQKAPPLTVQTLLQAPEGASARLEDLEGKILIVDFWATWCAPCIASIPHLNQLADHFAGEDVQFISITNEKPEVVESFLGRREMRGWIAIDPQGQSLKDYGVTGIPRTFIIGRDGTLLADTHPDALKAEHIERALRDEPVGLDPPARPLETVSPDGQRQARYGPTYLPGEFPGVGFEQNPLPTPLAQVIVRPALHPEGGAVSGSWDGNRNTWINHKAEHILRQAFGQAHSIPPTRVEVEGTIPEGGFDVAVYSPAGEPETYRRLVEAGIGGAFGASARIEEREVDVLVLRTDAAATHRLTPTASTGGSSTSMNTTDGRTMLVAINRRVADVASYLESSLKTPVLDETGITGGFDFELHLATDPDAARTAVEALGLRLSSERRTLQFLVVAGEAAEG